jgi:predicted GNAT family acetyltransferase
VRLGYQPSRNVYLVHAGGPAPAPPRADVEVAPLEDVLPALEHYLLTDADTEYGRDDVTRAHLVEHARRFPDPSVPARSFVVRDDAGAVVCWAKLWERDGVAQVEDVVCLAEHRGRGYGHDVVAAATRAALERDPDVLFIVADDADWPKDFYGRMGYERAGHIGLGLRHVPQRG